MPLLRHLLFSVTTALALLLIVSQALNIDKTRKSLGQQLRAHSEADATMLASAFSRDRLPSEESWRALAVDVFEHGDYARLCVKGPFLFRYHKPPAPTSSPPNWFVTMVSLESIAATRAFQGLNGGMGAVTVIADTTKAVRTLWQPCLQLVGLTAVAGLFWLLCTTTQIRWLHRRLLHEISLQVRALARGEAHPLAFPAGREAADVANALAEAREQFRITAQETHARIESLQLELNLDAVTRLPNRKYFFNELRRALNALVPPHRLPQQGTEAGYVVMFRQRDLAAINRYMPRDFTDQWLRSVARRLEQKVGGQHNPPFLLARLNGSDFALLLRDIPQEQALLHAEALRHELHTLRVCLDDQTWCRWALAIAPYWSGDHVSELLATLDHTLMRAESADTNAVLQAEKSAMGEAPGEHQWHDTLMMALEQHRFSLSTHAIENSAGVVLHYEGSLMLHEAKHCPPIHAQRFMPAAVRLGISSECDIQAVRLALDWLVSYTGKLAVPITLASLEQSNFASRLGQMLRDRPAQAGRLALEINAHDIIENFTPIRTLCEVVREAGSCIGLCQLAQDFNAMTKLHQLPLAYVKLGAAFVPSLPHSLGSRHLARCVMDTAHALKIAVYAEDANNETCKFLEDMGIMPVYPRTTLNRPLRCLHEP